MRRPRRHDDRRGASRVHQGGAAEPGLAAWEGRPGLTETLVHTGQHYDEEMAGGFFQELSLAEPIHLGVGSGSHGAQTGRALELLDGLIAARRPDLVAGVRRHQQHAGRGPGRRQAAGPGGSRRSRAALLEPGDARGDQPPAHRPPGHPAPVPLRPGGGHPRRRGDHRRSHRDRRRQPRCHARCISPPKPTRRPPWPDSAWRPAGMRWPPFTGPRTPMCRPGSPASSRRSAASPPPACRCSSPSTLAPSLDWRSRACRRGSWR